MNSFFTGRVAVLATMHRKEQAIAPIVEAELGVQVVVPDGFNTDEFGTFTRDRARSGDQDQAARLKAKAALQLTGKSLAIASEGSFGPHPSFPYIACDREIVLLLDQQHDLEVVGEVISMDTNYSHRIVSTLAEVTEFAASAGFPNHGLVVMPAGGTAASPDIIKGITTEASLIAAVTHGFAHFPEGRVHLETDMRAMYNPTRMQAIAQATHNLVQALRQTCPQCSTPGFAIVERKPGLPCMICSLPTSLTRSVVYQCQKCHFREEMYPEGNRGADPSHCSYCNP